MPLPTPNSGESRDSFVARCMTSIKDEFPDNKQRLAVCFSQFRKEDIHIDFKRILMTFIKHFKDNIGLNKFIDFIQKNNLDLSKSYSPSSQFQESFQWVKPLISFYKADKDAKYYLIRAITANISMNNNDYSDYETLMKAAPTMRMKPVNLNHDHKRWVEFPRTRVDMTGSEDMSVELSLRVDNEDDWLQRALDNGDIIHPSIEGIRFGDGRLEFTGLALLEKGVELPGDPLTEITSLVLNENVKDQICKVVDGEIVCENDCNVGEKNLSKEKEIDESGAVRAKKHFKLSDEKWDMLTDKQKQDFIDKLPPVVPEKDNEKELKLRQEIIKRDKNIEVLNRTISEGLAREEEQRKLKVKAEEVHLKREGELREQITDAEEEQVKLKGQVAAVKLEKQSIDNTYSKNVADQLKDIAELKTKYETEQTRITTDFEGKIESLNKSFNTEKTGLVKLHDEEKTGLNKKFIESREKHETTIKGLKEKYEVSKDSLADTKGDLNDCKRINLELKTETVAAKENEDRSLNITRDTQKRCEELSTLTRTQQEELSMKIGEVEKVNNKFVQQLSDNDVLRTKISDLRVNNRKIRNLTKQIIRASEKAGDIMFDDDGIAIDIAYIDKTAGTD